MAVNPRLKQAVFLVIKIGIAAGLLAWLLRTHTRLRPGDVRSWPAFSSALVEAAAREGPSPGKRLWDMLDAEAQQAMRAMTPGSACAKSDEAAALSALNKVLARRDFYHPADFQGVELLAEAKWLLRREPSAISQERVLRLNRVLLESAFRHHVVKSRNLDPYEIAAAVCAHPFWLALTFLIYNFCILMTANRWRMLVVSQGIPARRSECVGMTYIGCFFSCFLPGGTGGDLAKAYYVARDTPKKAEAVTTVFLDRVFGLYCMVGFATVAMLFHLKDLWRHPSPPSAFGLSQTQFLAVGVLSGFGLATVGLVVFLSSHCRRLVHFLLDRLPHRVGSVLKRVYEAAYLYRGRRLLLLKFVLYSASAHGGAAVAFWLLGRSLGEPLAMDLSRAPNYLFLIPLGLVLNGLPVAPAGVGVFEWALGFLFATLLLPGEQNLGANVAALSHVIIILTNQTGLFFYLAGKRKVAAAMKEARAAEPIPDPHA